MPRFDLIDGGADSEQEQVQVLIRSVFERGASSLDATRPEDVRARIDAAPVAVSFPEELSPIRLTDTKSNARNVKGTRRRKQWGALAVVLTAAAVVALVALALPSDPTTRHAAVPVTPHWRLVSSIGPASQSFGPTATTPTVGSDQSLNGITCPTITVCYSTVQTEVTSPIDGSFFQKVTGQTIAPGSKATYSLTTGVYVSQDGGESWSQLALPAGVSLNTRLTCPNATTCMVGAQPGQPNGWDDVRQQLLLVTHDSGAHWSELQVPMQSVTGIDPALDPSIAGLKGSLTQLTCFSADSCFAFGTVPSDQPISSLSGSALTQAEQVSEATVSRNVFMRTHDGGKHWSTFVFPWAPEPDGTPGDSNAEPASFSCPTEESCTGLTMVITNVSGAVNNTAVSPFSTLIWHTDNGGSSWSSFWPVSESQLQSLVVYPNLSCSDALHCQAHVATRGGQTGGLGIIRTSDGGSTWQLSPVLAGQTGELWTVTCPTAVDCWAVGGTLLGTNSTPGVGFILATHDGGQTWTQVPIPNGLTMVEGISCPSVTSCFAIGGSQTSVTGLLNQVEVLTDAHTSP
jgi:photosystem II stability/assembly factor-like uncharacterized protein